MRSVLNCFHIGNNWRSIWVRPNARYASLDGIRALSVIAVLMFHAQLFLRVKNGKPPLLDFGVFGDVISQLDRGVDGFFVLSGFLIGSMLFKEYQHNKTISLKSFYFRRFLRLTPAYLLLILLISLNPTTSNASLLVHIFYLQNFLAAKTQILPWTWSLAVEEQFYLLFPCFVIFLFAKSKHKLAVLMAGFLLSFLIRIPILLIDEKYYIQSYAASFHNPYFLSDVYDNLYTRYGSLLCGIIVAYLRCTYPDEVKRFFTEKSLLANGLMLCSIIGLMIIFGVLGITWMNGQHPNLQLAYYICHRNVFSVFVAYLMLASLDGQGSINELVRRFLSLSIWFPFAQLTYSIYLVHPVALATLAKLAGIATLVSGPFTEGLVLVVFLLVLLSSFVISLFIFMFVEKPFMNMRDLKIANNRPAQGELVKK